MDMSNKLTHKEKGFVEDVAKGLPGVKAALNNYDTDDYSTAGAIASENLKKPKIIKALEEALPNEMLIEIHREGLYASREVWKNNNETGQIEHVSDEADFQVRAKYLDMAYKLKGSYAAERHTSLNVNVDIPPNEKVKNLAKYLNKWQLTVLNIPMQS